MNSESIQLLAEFAKIALAHREIQTILDESTDQSVRLATAEYRDRVIERENALITGPDVIAKLGELKPIFDALEMSSESIRRHFTK